MFSYEHTTTRTHYMIYPFGGHVSSIIKYMWDTSLKYENIQITIMLTQVENDIKKRVFPVILHDRSSDKIGHRQYSIELM